MAARPWHGAHSPARTEGPQCVHQQRANRPLSKTFSKIRIDQRYIYGAASTH